MSTRSHDFVTVDMRGLKTALVERARADRISVSQLVRTAVSRELGASSATNRVTSNPADTRRTRHSLVKLSIRLTSDEAADFAAGAGRAGLSRGAYLAGLVSGLPLVSCGGDHGERRAALIASSSELSTLSKSIHHLTALLAQGDFRPAQEYHEMLKNLDSDIRCHLELASSVLSELSPRRGRRVAAESLKPGESHEPSL